MGYWLLFALVVVFLLSVLAAGFKVKRRRRFEADSVARFAPQVEAQIKQTLGELQVESDALQPRDVSQNWGHEVLVYGFFLPNAARVSPEQIQEIFPIDYALTDFWYREGTLFLEVALLRNSVTREYVHDIYRANQKS